MAPIRTCLTEHGSFPSRRTWERRLDDLPTTLPTRIQVLGQSLLSLFHLWPTGGATVAIDSTVLHAHGGVWRQHDRATGTVPYSSIDHEAHWTKSGWHGWGNDWKLHLVTAIADVWLQLAAELTPANVADNVPAQTLLRALPNEVHGVLGDCHYDDPLVREELGAQGRLFITSLRDTARATSEGLAVRRFLQQLRSHAIENFNEHLKAIFDVHGPVPTKGRLAITRYVLGAVLVYQLALWYRHATHGHLRRGRKPLLLAA